MPANRTASRKANLLSGFPLKRILLFSVPLLLSSLISQAYTLCDMAVVGHYLDDEAFAAVGASGTLVYFIFTTFWALCNGCAIITAQRFGANDQEGLRRSVATCFSISAITAVLLMATAIPLLSPLLRLIKTPEGAIFANSRIYLLWLLAGLPVAAFNNIVTAMIRALGDSLTPTIFLVVSAVVNIALNVACIVFLGMGVEGVAIATVVAQLVSSLGSYFYCYRKFPQLAPPWREWRNSAKTYWAHLRVALPMALQFMGTAVGFVLLQSALNTLGKNAINAYTVGNRTELFLGTPMGAFGLAVSTFVAQNYGAGLFDRIRKGIRQITAFSLSATAVLCLVMATGSGLAVDLLLKNAPAEIYPDVALYLRVCAVLYVFLSLIYIHRNALQGLGRAIVLRHPHG